MAGMVAAGPTTLAFLQNDRVDFSEIFFKDDRFILRVSGDSMIDAHITDGDYVVVQKQSMPNRARWWWLRQPRAKQR